MNANFFEADLLDLMFFGWTRVFLLVSVVLVLASPRDDFLFAGGKFLQMTANRNNVLQTTFPPDSRTFDNGGEGSVNSHQHKRSEECFG